MGFLCLVEYVKLLDFGDDGVVESSALYEALLGLFGFVLLLRVMVEDRSEVLGAPVYELATVICGINVSPEDVEYFIV